jgi:hypothetical protein
VPGLIVLSEMIRNFIFLTLTLLLQACDREDNISVTIHVQGAESTTAGFPSYEKASDWISKSCEPLWHQAKAKGRSARFHITSTGSELGGIVESPQFGFESPDGNAMRLIQFDETYGNSPKIEGDGLQWHSAECYIKEQIMMNSVFGTHNRKYTENKP